MADLEMCPNCGTKNNWDTMTCHDCDTLHHICLHCCFSETQDEADKREMEED